MRHQTLCIYLVRRVSGKDAENADTSYPYAYLLSSGENDTGLYGISKNGQYVDFNSDFPGSEHLLNKAVSDLAKQNRVRHNIDELFQHSP